MLDGANSNSLFYFRTSKIGCAERWNSYSWAILIVYLALNTLSDPSSVISKRVIPDWESTMNEKQSKSNDWVQRCIKIAIKTFFGENCAISSPKIEKKGITARGERLAAVCWATSLCKVSAHTISIIGISWWPKGSNSLLSWETIGWRHVGISTIIGGRSRADNVDFNTISNAMIFIEVAVM